MSHHILVLGGTGFLGTPAAHELARAGHRVRVLARDVNKARPLLGDDIEIAPGNALGKSDVQRALAGCDAVHISLNYGIELPAVRAVLDWEGRDGLKRITYVSGTTVCEEHRWFDLVDEKVRVEEAIIASDIPYTIFCPTWFFEMMANFIVDGRALLIGKHPHPYHWMSRADFIQTVVAAYDCEPAINKRFYVHGPEAITMQDALRRYIHALYPNINSLTVVPPRLLWLVATLTENKRRKMASRMMSYFSKVGEPGDPSEANALFGAPTTTLDQWLALMAESA